MTSQKKTTRVYAQQRCRCCLGLFRFIKKNSLWPTPRLSKVHTCLVRALGVQACAHAHTHGHVHAHTRAHTERKRETHTRTHTDTHTCRSVIARTRTWSPCGAGARAPCSEHAGILMLIYCYSAPGDSTAMLAVARQHSGHAHTDLHRAVGEA